MIPVARVYLVISVLVIFGWTDVIFQTVPAGVLARSLQKRAVMEFDQMDYQQDAPQNDERRTHIVKIHSTRQRSNDPVLDDVTSFRGIGNDHNAFGGPKYAGQYYPLLVDQNNQQARANNFSFGNLLSGLALWNLANEFNMYSSQDPHHSSLSRSIQLSSSTASSNNHQLTNQYDQRQISDSSKNP